MESWSEEEIKLLLSKVEGTIEKIIQRNQSYQSVDEYLSNESGLEKLDAACMLIQTIGENIKTIHIKTKGELFVNYPEIPWKNVMRMRDYISHHYDGVDAEVVFETIKHHLPQLLIVLKRIQNNI